MLTCGRRTTGSSGYVLSWLISAPQTGSAVPRWNTHAFFLFLPSRSLTLSNAMASRRPRRARTRTTCISARSTALPVRYASRSIPSLSHRIFVFSFISFPRDPKTILILYLFPFQNATNVTAGRNRSRVRGLQLRKPVGSRLGLRLRRYPC